MLSLLDSAGLFAVLGGLGVAIVTWFVAYWRGKSQGAADANAKAMEDDFESAMEIRRRVGRDRAQRVRELDDAGYRD